MSQRVSITYSLNIEDVPHEANRLFKSCHADLISLGKRVQKEWKADEGCAELIDNIEGVREELQALYLRLADVTTIMGGYLAWEAQQAPPPIEEAEAEEEEDPTALAVGELEQRLQSLKESLAPPGSDETTD